MNYSHLRPGRSAELAPHAPHAALLIDFDNVTLGIRSDLTKELKNLLNSDIIKGKVAVQRAYADWRRYPQYIVPLSESSIDLIFAPAFGTTKKNATDIRLAIDAVELVFTRPEIGTFIVMSGDSDFSAMVIKLKEYGKYVVGVGIRESASDLLIQNCDEYYSYTDLAGLTKEGETPSIQRDPWELVGEAVGRMGQHGDVMRSDRLKQVMQQIDPNFDERNAGFNRFSKFVTEAANRGLLQLTKLDNGQFEISAVGAAPAKGERPSPRSAAPEKPADAAREERGASRRRGRRGRGREREREGAAADSAPAEPPARPAATGLTLARAFQLMTEALTEFRGPATHEQLRSRMVAMLGKEDELLDPERFPRLLRQANDAEVADVRSAGDNEYEISLHRRPAYRASEPAVPAASEENGASAPEPAPESAPSAARRGVRFRRGSRAPSRPAEVPLVGVVKMADKTAGADKADEASKATKATKASRTSRAKKPSKPNKADETGKAGETAKATKAVKATKATKPRTRTRKKAAAKPAGGDEVTT
ncbi:MAG TPA: NYN domain-containing protein [Gemmatimonadales bacterium]|nr:NYN domain-containing protein [Gemmatimonadales bacterium]